MITLGQILLAQGDSEGAYAVLTEALRLTLALGSRVMIAYTLEGLAASVVTLGQAQLTVQWLAAAAVLREQMGTPVRPVDQAAVNTAAATARSPLGENAFAAAWEQARALPLEQLLNTIALSA